jgi:hypothetical protein
MTLGDLVLSIIMVAIFIEAFINIRKIGFEDYSINKGLGKWLFFCFRLAFLLYACIHFLMKIDLSYEVF